MKTKLMLSLLLALSMMVSYAFATEGNGGLFDSVSNWFDQTWNDASGWVSQAWTDATSWINGAWGDASKWIEHAWNDSSIWVTDIWGDVSNWANDTTDAIEIWWSDTFNNVTKNKNNTWEWIDDEFQDAIHKSLVMRFENSILTIQNGNSDIENNLDETYKKILSELKLTEDESAKVIETIQAYAKEKNIEALSLKKILLPYLFQLKIDSETIENGKIPAIAVAQYLTGIVEKLGIENDEQAKQLINELDEILNSK